MLYGNPVITGVKNENGKIKEIEGRIDPEFKAEYIFFRKKKKVIASAEVQKDGSFVFQGIDLDNVALATDPVYVKNAKGGIFCYEELPSAE
ncbi:MAG: hypothetical protein D6698_00370 [Gammaproteobacteria bacterium]|nr:MAG: hypothetical protein D6698_00370 [Gammaproteobacteria bacterium]